MHSIARSDVPYVWWSGGRVKRLAITRADPYLFWSAAEDGYIKWVSKRSLASLESNFKMNKENELVSLFRFSSSN